MWSIEFMICAATDQHFLVDAMVVVAVEVVHFAVRHALHWVTSAVHRVVSGVGHGDDVVVSRRDVVADCRSQVLPKAESCLRTILFRPT